MRNVCWSVLLAWWVFVAHDVAYIDRQTGRTYPGVQWRPTTDRYIYRDFCEGRARELRERGERAECREIKD